MRLRIALTAICLGLGLCAAAPLRAQSDDPLAYDPEESAPAATFTWLGDLLLRYDATNDLPLNLPDERRALVRARAGFRWQPSDAWEIGATIEGSRGSESARVIRLAHDNQRTNDLVVDRLYAQWRGGENTRVTLGKSDLGLQLTPMVWDDELRPVGVGFEHSVPLGDFDRFTIAGGAWLGDHIYGDTSRVVGVQAGWRFREGAPTSGSILLGVLGMDHLDDLIASGLARSNRRIGNELVSDFHLADLQLSFDTEFVGRPLRSRLDLVRNFGADDQRDGVRVSTIWGDARRAGDWEVGLAYQRIQRDAVMAAFNSEDWWFHTAMRGAMPWVGYGFNEHWRVQLALFLERNDGRAEDLERALLDLRAQW